MHKEKKRKKTPNTQGSIEWLLFYTVKGTANRVKRSPIEWRKYLQVYFRLDVDIQDRQILSNFHIKANQNNPLENVQYVQIDNV